MSPLSQRAMRAWLRLGTRFLPFADAATPELPLARLLRLSLFQVSVGMTLALLIGTLNRVMIVELGVSAALVSVMIALPVLFAPFRALVGFRSDTHRSQLGWRRVPFMYRGTMLQFGGLAIMPFALLVLSGTGQGVAVPSWVGQAAAGLSFLLVGMGLHITQTAGLALATDLSAPAQQPKVVGLMYVMLLVGTVAGALAFGAWLADYTPGRLVQVVQGAAVLAIVLNAVAVWKQEPRRRGMAAQADAAGFAGAWLRYRRGDQALRRLLVIALGTMAFTMEDVLLEPYGGEVLRLGVGATTQLSALLALGGLFGFGWASRVLGRGADPGRMAAAGSALGLPAFAAVIAAGPLASPGLFAAGTFLIGFGAGLFGHGTLTATMNRAPPEQAGLALGAWGAVQATAAGTAIAFGGVLRDLVTAAGGRFDPAAAVTAGYVSVYGVELLLLLLTLAALWPLLPAARRGRPAAPV